MKLITFAQNNTISCGVLTENGIVDIPRAWKTNDAPKTLLEILERGRPCLDKISQISQSAREFIPLNSVKLLAPLQRPGKIIALAGNYSEHIKEAGLSLGLSDSPRQTTVPRPFIKPATCVLNPGDQIPWPVYSEKIDYELELAVVIGKKIKSVEIADALDAVAGYTIVNDVSARSTTFAKGRAKRPWDEFYDWLIGKWADGFLPMGPYIATSDEIPNVQNLKMELKVNDETRQKANTSQMIYSVADIVSFLSRIMTLEPGDIIATGTPAGVAMASGKFLNAGDRIEGAIESLGTLTNYPRPQTRKILRTPRVAACPLFIYQLLLYLVLHCTFNHHRIEDLRGLVIILRGEDNGHLFTRLRTCPVDILKVDRVLPELRGHCGQRTRTIPQMYHNHLRLHHLVSFFLQCISCLRHCRWSEGEKRPHRQPYRRRHSRCSLHCLPPHL